MKRSLAIAVSLLTFALVSGCGGDDPEDTTDPETSTSESTSEDGGESEPPAGGGVLNAVVGGEDNPDEAIITLTDESGAAVTELPAGDYTINVRDQSAIHNFHLIGGSVDETTTVPEIADATWEVTLEAGDYTFKCDPHPPMIGEFTVT